MAQKEDSQFKTFYDKVEVKDRSYHFRTFRKCFVGKDAVSCMVLEGLAENRAGAVALGNEWIAKGLLHHVTRSHEFKDDNLFYNFVPAVVANYGVTASGAEGDNPHLMMPDDEANRRLLRNVHPHNYVNPQPQDQYQMVVIGGGTAGLVTAAAAAGLGAKVAMIEREYLGGDCLNSGCVPSKALLSAAHAIATARNGAAFGLTNTEAVKVDFPKVMERMRTMRADISPDDSVERFTKELGIDVFLGTGKFVAKDAVMVDGKTLRFKRCCIATGARAAALPIPGLKEAGFLTNETVFSLTELPPRMAVIGAGPIGCELAQAFQRFGSEVVLLEVQRQILAREDPDAAAVVCAALERDGVKIKTAVDIVGVSLKAGEDGPRVLEIKNKGTGETEHIEVDEILLGVGRTPNTDGLGLDVAGVEFDKRGVKVNDYLQTTNGNIYAAGDIASQYKFTHAADFLARIVIRNALFHSFSKASALTVPWCTYTSPEIAHVGVYEHEVRAAGGQVQTFRRDLKDVHRAILDGDGDEGGFVKIHVKPGSDKIIGATIVARNAGDLISEISVAMAGGVGLQQLASVIHPYPTQAEAIRQIGDAYNRTRLTPSTKRLLTWVMPS